MSSADDAIGDEKQLTTNELLEKINFSIAQGNAQLAEKLTNECGKMREVTNKLQNDVQALVTSQNAIAREVNEIKQEQLNNTIEIDGISSTLLNSSTLSEVFSDLLTSYKIQFDPKVITRVRKRDITVKGSAKSLLVVTFNSYEEKMKLFKAKIACDKIKRSSIYFNHALTPANRRIFMASRAAAKTSDQVSAYIAEGRIYLKLMGQSRGTQIKSLEDIDNFNASIKTYPQGSSASVIQTTSDDQTNAK